jgi:hypothetical protein
MNAFALQRMQLRMMTKSVKALQFVVQKSSRVLRAITDPFVYAGVAIYKVSPILVVLLSSTIGAYLPLVLYFRLKEYFLDHSRQIKEQERIRLSLQKGIDPFPDFNFKELVFKPTMAWEPSKEMRTEGALPATQSVWRQKELKSGLMLNQQPGASVHEVVRAREDHDKKMRQVLTAGRSTGSSDGFATASRPLRTQEEVDTGKEVMLPVPSILAFAKK